jgi:hypothetical protein
LHKALLLPRRAFAAVQDAVARVIYLFQPHTTLLLPSPLKEADLVQCSICEELLRKYREVAAQLAELNETFGVGGELPISLRERDAVAYATATEALRSAHEKCAEARTTFLEHLRNHSALAAKA